MVVDLNMIRTMETLYELPCTAVVLAADVRRSTALICSGVADAPSSATTKDLLRRNSLHDGGDRRS